jgi:hypothetical protein
MSPIPSTRGRRCNPLHMAARKGAPYIISCMGWVGMEPTRVGYVEKVPETFGQLGRTRGLYFGCAGCSRGRMFEQAELVQRWGTEGRVADLAKRLTCSNCKARRKRPPPIYVEVTKLLRSKSEQARATMTLVDALVYDIGQLKPKRTIE